MEKAKRVPWHATLFAGALFFGLTGGYAAAALLGAGGLGYMLWPRLRRRQIDADGDPQ